jgi:hypothetical protein
VSIIPMLTLASGVVHSFLSTMFRPKMQLNLYTSLQPSPSEFKAGQRSTASVFEMSWTCLNSQRNPPSTRCCHICNPGVAQMFEAGNAWDRRLHQFASDFIFPLESPPARSSSSASTASISTTTTQASYASQGHCRRRSKLMPKDHSCLEVLLDRLLSFRLQLSCLRSKSAPC